MVAIKGADKFKKKLDEKAPAAAPPIIKPPEPLKTTSLDVNLIGGILEIMAKNLERLGAVKPMTEIKVSAPSVREYVIKHVWDKNDNRITESIITVRGEK